MKNMDEELYEMQIPANAIKSGRFLNIKWTHWVEAFSILVAVTGIVMNINFVFRIKMILISVIGISLFVLLLRGIKGRTLTQFFVNAIKNYAQRREYHLGGVDDDSRKEVGRAQYAGQSGAERFVSAIRQKNRELERRYGTDGAENNPE